MITEDARDNLPGWLIHNAVLGRFRCMEDTLEETDKLTQRAYQLLGDVEYKKIYDRTVKDVCG